MCEIFGELIFRGFKKHINLELLSRKLPGTHMQCDSSDIYQIRLKTFDKHQNVQTFYEKFGLGGGIECTETEVMPPLTYNKNLKKSNRYP